jgi:Werner syndrome ATP-dependent helicase
MPSFLQELCVLAKLLFCMEQSLEAYYQEAGRAGRDGLPSDCQLFVDMTVLPSLLPSRREAGQTKHALDMLSQCFRYAISADRCRVQILLDYFGEDLESGICDMCDTCVKGPSPSEDLTNEALLLLTALAAPQVTSHTGSTNCSIVCMCL